MQPAREVTYARIGRTRQSEEIRKAIHAEGLTTLDAAKAIILSAGYPHQAALQGAAVGWAWECPRCHALTDAPPESMPEYCWKCGQGSKHWTGREATAYYLNGHSGGQVDPNTAVDLALSLGFWLNMVLSFADDAIITAWVEDKALTEEEERVVSEVAREFEA